MGVSNETVLTVSLSAALAAAVYAFGASALPAPSEVGPSGQRVAVGCRQVPLTSLAGSGVGGAARLCIGGEGIGAAIDAENLTVGHTYTAWLTYFDHRYGADESLRDTPEPTPAGLSGRIDGRVAEARTASFSVDLPGLRLGAPSEVTLSLFGRRPVGLDDERSRAGQLLLPRTLAAGATMPGVVAAGETGPRLASATFVLRPQSADYEAGR